MEGVRKGKEREFRSESPPEGEGKERNAFPFLLPHAPFALLFGTPATQAIDYL